MCGVWQCTSATISANNLFFNDKTEAATVTDKPEIRKRTGKRGLCPAKDDS